MVSLNLDNPVSLESFSTPVPVRQFSVAEYESMGRAGILGEDDNVELLEGWIALKMTKNPLHEFILGELEDALRSRLPQGYYIRNQSVVATTDSRPEPDLAIVRGTRRDHITQHPQPHEISLVIEVADTSLSRDRFKRQIYARAGIASYWIVNLVDRCVEVFATPVTDAAVFQQGYRFFPGETLTVTLCDGASFQLPVADFLSAC